MTANSTNVLRWCCSWGKTDWNKWDNLTTASTVERVRRNKAGLLVLLLHWKATIKLWKKMLSNPQSLSLAVSFPGFFTVMRHFCSSSQFWTGVCVFLSLSLSVSGGRDYPKGFPTDTEQVRKAYQRPVKTVACTAPRGQSAAVHSSLFLWPFHSPSFLLTSSFILSPSWLSNLLLCTPYPVQ